jgi:anti-anti-sigma regulatory factor
MSKSLFRISLPALFTIVLFVIVVFVFTVPFLEDSLVERKREMTRELTETAWSVLAHYHELEQEGILTRDEAQAQAAAQVREMRYGPEHKDYFWINDMRPYMIAHPFRPDLEGKDVSDFADPDGKYIFLTFVELAQASGQGYVDYMWQWKDDAEQIVPKVSYIKLFEPWQWIVGTGAYVRDVQAEIDELTNRLVVLSLGVLAIVALLLSVTIAQSYRAERKRSEAENALYTNNRELEERTVALEQEIILRKQTEKERTRQLEILKAQQRTIQELSTPIIPVMEAPGGAGGIIVMPLVGSVDATRARDIMRALLAGIREHRARVVILDITGVPIVDSGVASYLNKAIQAARLKGAQTIVTGISDDVAEAIVNLGIDWSGITTLDNLQTGLAAALNSLGIELNGKNWRVFARQRVDLESRG